MFKKGHKVTPYARKPKVMVWDTVKLHANRIKDLPTTISVPGIRYLKKHLSGVILGRKQAMDAKCADCMGYYVDGRGDCKMEFCPMYPYMPYKKDGKDMQDVKSV